MKKFALFVFNGDPMCFIHVLLNGLDLHSKGHYVRIVLEGAAVKLIPELNKNEHPLHGLWIKSREADLVAGACQACSHNLGTLDAAREQGLPLLADMKGHPGMGHFIAEGFQILTF